MSLAPAVSTSSESLLPFICHVVCVIWNLKILVWLLQLFVEISIRQRLLSTWSDILCSLPFFLKWCRTSRMYHSISTVLIQLKWICSWQRTALSAGKRRKLQRLIFSFNPSYHIPFYSYKVSSLIYESLSFFGMLLCC